MSIEGRRIKQEEFGLQQGKHIELKPVSTLRHHREEFLDPEKKDSRLVVEIHELKDQYGKGLCFAEMKFFADHKEHERRVLVSFKLLKDKKIIDVLKLIDLKSPVGAIVLTDPRADDSFKYSHPKKSDQEEFIPTVVIPPLDSFVGIAIALHEFGHAKQMESPYFQTMNKLRNRKEGKIEVLAKKFVGQFPELAPSLPSPEVFEELRKLEMALDNIEQSIKARGDVFDRLDQQVKDLRLEISVLKDKIRIVGFIERIRTKSDLEQSVLHEDVTRKRLIDVGNELKVLYAARNAKKMQVRRAGRPVRDFLGIFKKIRERDATRRAFGWMIEIKRTIGLDIATAPVKKPTYAETYFARDPGSKESTKRVLDILARDKDVSAKNVLLDSLSSYDAFEKIPVPSLKRLEQMEHEEEEKEKQKSSGI